MKGACQRQALAHTHHRHWLADIVTVLYAPSQRDGWGADRRSFKEDGEEGEFITTGKWGGKRSLLHGRRMPSAEAEINVFFLTL